MEEEFTPGTHAEKELLGVQELLGELKFKVGDATDNRDNSQVVIRQLANEKSSVGAKHIDIKLKFVKHYAKNGIVKPSWVTCKTFDGV